MSSAPLVRSENRAAALENARKRMGSLLSDNQVLGRRNAIGCVALEITQRCNLDCTLCYLSENSQRVKDMPIEEVFRRIDGIAERFGAPTAVQITGGDPTLRKRDELVAIVRRVRERGLLPTLMTNGIKASREMLRELAEAGLNDVAFHVDLTQERKGYATEADLNAVREEYIERARGIPIAVIFNTTVCRENFDEIPDMIRFFRRHADVVGMASFQLQADTGRGVLRERDRVISLETVRRQIEAGAQLAISWDTIRIGHPSCHRIGITLEANGNLYDLNDDPDFFNRFLEDFQHVMLDRREPGRAVRSLLGELKRRPAWAARALRFAARKLWTMRRDLLAARGRVHKLSFFVQNFMDASALEPERIHACSFMVMTANGPISMCAHNARRDEFILKPIAVTTPDGEAMWNPLSGGTLPVLPSRPAGVA
ncbi:MAG: radical SAM protein [Acidobacteriota bacterium]